MATSPEGALPAALDPDLAAVARLAEDEARRRGQAHVDGRHLAYALTRHPAGQAAVAQAGIDPLWWRDHIAFVEGVNAKDCRHGGTIAPWRPLADDVAITWHPRALAILRVAVEEAGAAGRGVAGPADLLSALRLEGLMEPAGTLMKLGVSVARVRAAAGHPHPTGRPKPPFVPPIRPPAARGGPLVLLGEDLDPSPGHVRALDLARARPGRPPGAPLRLLLVQTAVSAPSPPASARERILRLYGAGAGELEVIDAGLRTTADARSAAVLERVAAADVVHLAGGNTGRLYDATAGSPFLEALARASVAGAVLIGGSAGAMVFGAGMWSDWYSGDPAQKETVPLWTWLDRVLIEPHYWDWDKLIWQRLADSPGHIVLGIPNRGAALVLPGREEVEALGPEPLSVHTAPDAPPTVVPVGRRYRLPA